MKRLLSRFYDFLRLFQSRLSLQIVFWIFLSIAVIETILLVPSVERRKQEVLARIAEVSSGKMIWIFATYPEATGAELLEHTRQLYTNPMLRMIVGGAVYKPDGNLVGTFGEPPVMTFGEAQKESRIYLLGQGGDRYEVAWKTPQTDGEHAVVIRHNAEIMRSEIYAYILRILGLVFIISAFVTLVMLITLGPLVITPILTLRRDLARAGEAVHHDQLTPNFDSSAIKRQDELGEVITAFQHMFAQICQAMSERKQAEKELLQANQQMQQYIQQASQVTTAAAEVEQGSFQPESLAEVALRDDELGQLARVFQQMASEVKQRETQLKQQIADLKIEIDQRRREQEVAQVVQSGYFKELQQEVDRMNLDEFWR
ncbi:MAG: HAMP domain-containing protein [Leptolyngbyaceae cyanobacterium HOT.MB2.61]|jgi:PAS domain-containing protein|nr:HAMP domain-containing protein [Leptolyngbyaceae cyanobacterium HOT.MB2.61]